MFFKYRKRERGFTLLSLLMGLMIIGVLSQSYLTTRGPDGKTFAVSVQDRARTAVMSANLNAARTNYFMKTEGRRPNPDQLRQIMDELSRSMGGSGRFFIGPDDQIRNTAMIDTPMFRERIGEDLPMVR